MADRIELTSCGIFCRNMNDVVLQNAAFQHGMQVVVSARFLNLVRKKCAAVEMNRCDTTAQHLPKLPREADYAVALRPMTLCAREGIFLAQLLVPASVLPLPGIQHKEPS